MGAMKYKASFIIYLKQILRYVPFLNYLCNCEPVQKITIPLVENFNNADFSARSLEFTLTSTSLSFTSAKLHVRSSLFGIRYFMRSWFFTTAFTLICSTAFTFFLTFLAFFTVVKSNIRIILLKLYPE